MKTAIEKTKEIERKDLSVDLLVKNEQNPNEMGKREFNLLVDNIEKTGLTDPIFVRPLPDGKFRIVGGHHRFDAAVLLGFEEVPCTIIRDPNFDEDQEKYQVVRMNVIRGRLSPQKFLKLYESLNEKYESEVMAEAFGFADEEQFSRLIKQMAKSLPKDLQADFKNAAKEIKTIDGLSKLLNDMFSRFGDTLDYGYMIVDFGGKDSVWLRLASGDMKNFKAVAEQCVGRKRSVDSLMRLVMQLIAADKLPQVMEQLMSFPEIQTTKGEVPLESNA